MAVPVCERVAILRGATLALTGLEPVSGSTVEERSGTMFNWLRFLLTSPEGVCTI